MYSFVVLVAAAAMVVAGNSSKFALKLREPSGASEYYVRTRTSLENPTDDERIVLFATKSDTTKYTLAYFELDDNKMILMHVPGGETVGLSSSSKLYLNGPADLKLRKQREQNEDLLVLTHEIEGTSLYACQYSSDGTEDVRVIWLVKPAEVKFFASQKCVAVVLARA